jgi:cytochrome c-type biogenesis protein CcmH/NrfF
VLQKAKSENKYYAAMRDKEALENERKNIMRNLEKQSKAVEKLAASEKSLAAQVVRKVRLLQCGSSCSRIVFVERYGKRIDTHAQG